MFKYIKVDETNRWSKEFRKKYSIIFMTATYAFDDEEKVNCCEITPSYYMKYLGSEPSGNFDISYELRESFHEDMMEAELHCGDSDCYMHCSLVNKMMPKKVIQDCETLDEVAEEFCANPW